MEEALHPAWATALPLLLLGSLSAGPKVIDTIRKKAHTGRCALGLQPEALVLTASLLGGPAQFCQGL